MIRAAIVGMGSWGRHLVESVQGSTSIRFTCAATRTPDKVAEFAAEHHMVLRSSYADLLTDPEVDAVVLTTPHSLHAEQIVAAAQAGKHVFTEKPLALTAESARAAALACASHRVTLAVGYNWRFQPALQKIKQLLLSRGLGKLLHVEGNFCGPSAYRFPPGHWRHDNGEAPAGGMTGRGVHLVDAMLYLAGRIDSVNAQSFRLAHDFGVDDTTSMLFRFSDGATGYLGTVIATAETWRIQVFGTKGWAEVGDVEHLTTWELRVCHVDDQDLYRKRHPETIRFAPVSTERLELEHFAGAAEEGRPIVTADGDEVHNAAVLEAITRSVQRRVAIRP